jgi:tungstate transport system ATP-binding protein
VSLNSVRVKEEMEAQGLEVVLGGRQVLSVPELKLLPHEVLVIIGPNGSGKTTLLLTLAMLLKPASGSVSYHGRSVWNGASILEMRRNLAVVFQEPLLLSTSVWENVTLGLRLRGFKKEEIKSRSQKWLERFGVADLAYRQAKTLSGGEAKRVSLARAFALQPDILFLDEPFNGLDSPTRQAVLQDFEQVLKETSVTTVMVTHDRDEALALGHRVVVLMDGHVRQIGTPQQVFSMPVDEEVASFVEAGNILHGVVTSQRNGLVSVEIEGQRVQAVSNLDISTRVSVYLHYEDVTISLPLSKPMYSSARNQIKGKIVKVFPFDSQLKVTLNCGFTLFSLITRHSWEELGLEIGQEIVASFKASSVHLTPKL